MKAATKVKVKMVPVNRVITRIGANRDGAVQRFVTQTVNRRITRFMPYRTGWLSGKAKYIRSSTEIAVQAPYARYQYYGKKMVPVSGGGPFYLEGVGWRFRRGTVLRTTDIPLDQSGGNGPNNPFPGPFWDRRMMAAEGEQIAEEVQAYVDRRGR